jgi:hypothetical protein
MDITHVYSQNYKNNTSMDNVDRTRTFRLNNPQGISSDYITSCVWYNVFATVHRVEVHDLYMMRDIIWNN